MKSGTGNKRLLGYGGDTKTKLLPRRLMLLSRYQRRWSCCNNNQRNHHQHEKQAGTDKITLRAPRYSTNPPPRMEGWKKRLVLVGCCSCIILDPSLLCSNESRGSTSVAIPRATTNPTAVRHTLSASSTVAIQAQTLQGGGKVVIGKRRRRKPTDQS